MSEVYPLHSTPLHSSNTTLHYTDTLPHSYYANLFLSAATVFIHFLFHACPLTCLTKKSHSEPTVPVVNVLLGLSFPGGWLAWRWSVIGGRFDVFGLIIFLLDVLLVLRASEINHAVGQRRRTWWVNKQQSSTKSSWPALLPEGTIQSDTFTNISLGHHV